MTTGKLIKEDLWHFTGSENWYRHPFNPKITYTDGARFVAEEGGAYWLLDAIVICQRTEKAVAGEGFQLWKLAVKADHTAVLTCDDGNGNVVYTQYLDYTDFPLDEISFFFTNNVIHLPSEY